MGLEAGFEGPFHGSLGDWESDKVKNKFHFNLKFSNIIILTFILLIHWNPDIEMNNIYWRLN